MATSPVTISGSAESSPHLMNSNVLSYRRGAEKLKQDSAGEGQGAGAAGMVYTPSDYLLLVSRLENMVRRGAAHRATLERLRGEIGRQLATLPEAARQRIQGTEEYARLGAEDFAQLPQALMAALQDAERSQAALDLLKQPIFAAYMRNEARARVYGPQGVMRAS